MADFSITLHGMEDVKRKLKSMPPRVAERVQRLALRKGAAIIAKSIRARAPVKTGRLKKSVKVRNSKINRLERNGKIGVYVTLYPGKSRNDKNGAWYGKFVEVGYNRGSKAIGGNEAIARGIITRDQYHASRAFVNSKRRLGQVRQGVRYRAGGKRVEGQHFVRDAFESSKETASRVIVEASIFAVDHVAKTL